ncbi:MAG: hypothetical protein NVSMB32_02460 [Actinomycetota bacterium]
MEDLQRWFGPLNPRLTDRDPATVGPDATEMRLLLDMGKLAAEAAPQRMVALLTAFSVGRALGRVESHDPAVDPHEFLLGALGHVRAVAREADSVVDDDSNGANLTT